MIKRTIFGIAVVLSSAPALAQSNDGSQMPAHRSEISGGLAEVPVAPTGLALQLGGGVTGFTRENARDSFGTGGYWDARAILGNQSFLGAELAYVGSAREVKEPGVWTPAPCWATAPRRSRGSTCRSPPERFS